MHQVNVNLTFSYHGDGRLADATAQVSRCFGVCRPSVLSAVVQLCGGQGRQATAAAPLEPRGGPTFPPEVGAAVGELQQLPGQTLARVEGGDQQLTLLIIAQNQPQHLDGNKEGDQSETGDRTDRSKKTPMQPPIVCLTGLFGLTLNPELSP